jgi:hypothetical protein
MNHERILSDDEAYDRLSNVQCRTRQFLQNAADRGLMDLFLHEVDLPQTGLKWTLKFLRKAPTSSHPCFSRTAFGNGFGGETDSRIIRANRQGKTRR